MVNLTLKPLAYATLSHVVLPTNSASGGQSAMKVSVVALGEEALVSAR